MDSTDDKYLTTDEAAELIGMSSSYMAYLRTETAKARNHKGPPYLRVNLNDGSLNAIRIKYDREELEAWNAKRLELITHQPTVEHIAG